MGDLEHLVLLQVPHCVILLHHLLQQTDDFHCLGPSLRLVLAEDEDVIEVDLECPQPWEVHGFLSDGIEVSVVVGTSLFSGGDVVLGELIIADLEGGQVGMDGVLD